MKVDNVRKIITEDFPRKDQETVSKLAESLNHFMDHITAILTHRIDFKNLNQEIITIKVTVDGSGVPTKSTPFSTTYISRARGAIVISAINNTTASNIPTATPFLTFVPTATNLYKLNYVSGLQAGDEYQLTVLLIGRDI